MSDCLRCPVCSCAHYLYHCTRDRGCSAHPAFPAPSEFGEGGKFLANLGRNAFARTQVLTRHPEVLAGFGEPRRMNRPQPGRRPSRLARARTSRVSAKRSSVGDGFDSGHCEERLRRSNPYFLSRSMDCFASLAMTVARSKIEIEKFIESAICATPKQKRGRSPRRVRNLANEKRESLIPRRPASCRRSSSAWQTPRPH